MLSGSIATPPEVYSFPATEAHAVAEPRAIHRRCTMRAGIARQTSEKRPISAVSEGEIKGEAKKTKEIALNSIQIGLANETIAQITGLTTPEIEERRQKCKQ